MSPIVKESEVLTANPETGTPASRAASAEAAKAQPVALEISVTVNGARTIEGSDKREPFSESTKTVLVLGTGAVIRLASAVAPGQLLFLTNDKTKKEVVCQVVKSKNFRNVSGYVELEFTEPAVGFWGMRFPTDRLGAQPQANASVPAAGAPSVPVATPKVVVPPPPVPAAAALSPKPIENKIPAPAPLPSSPLPAIPAASSKPVSPVASTNSSYSSTTMSSASPNSSVLSLPRGLEMKSPEAPAPTATPVATPPTVVGNATPMRRASDQKKPVPPVSDAQQVASPSTAFPNATKVEEQRQQDQLSSLLAAAANHPKSLATAPIADSADRVLEFAKLQNVPPAVKTTANPPASFNATSSLDLAAEETKIPAWLEPLARNATAPTSTQELIEREKAKHAASAADLFQAAPVPVSVSEPVTEEMPSTQVELPTPTFGAGLLDTEPIISEGASPSGSKKGLLFGLLAASVAIAAGGWWYLQQTPHNVQAQPAAAAISAPVNPASSPLTNNPAPTTGTAAGSVATPTVVTPKTNSPVSPAPVESANTTLSTNPAEKAARVPQPTPVVAKKPSLGDVRLATPTVSATGDSNLSATAAPSFTNEEMVPESVGAGAGLGGNSHRQPAAPAPALPVGGDVKSAKLISQVAPIYPVLAKNQHVSGDVKVDALVDATGRVTAMKIMSGPTLLHQAAMDAIHNWKYQPATLDGKAVPMHLTVTLQFRLQQ